MSFNGELQVLTSREFKISGAIGCVTSLERKSPCVSDQGAPRQPNSCARSTTLVLRCVTRQSLRSV